jgi:hypothetical protein
MTAIDCYPFMSGLPHERSRLGRDLLENQVDHYAHGYRRVLSDLYVMKNLS